MQPPPSSIEYPTELPATLPISEHEVPPLVKVAGLQAHLYGFGHSKYTAQHSAAELPRSMQLEYPQILSLNRPAPRFETPTSAAWPSGVAVASTKATLPPLGVLTVRHTYLLVMTPLPIHFLVTYPSTSRTHARRNPSSTRTSDLSGPQFTFVGAAVLVTT